MYWKGSNDLRGNRLKIKPLYPDSKAPERKTSGAAGYDLYSHTSGILPPGSWATIPTGVAMEIPPGCYGAVRGRSSILKRGMIVDGTIDEDYRGEVYVMIYNTSDDAQNIIQGERIAQLVVQRYEGAPVEIVEELSKTERGDKGFGSTGR